MWSLGAEGGTRENFEWTQKNLERTRENFGWTQKNLRWTRENFRWTQKKSGEANKSVMYVDDTDPCWAAKWRREEAQESKSEPEGNEKWAKRGEKRPQEAPKLRK